MPRASSQSLLASCRRLGLALLLLIPSAPVGAAVIRFGAPVFDPEVIGPYDVDLADLDRDGHLDLLAAVYDGGLVSVRLGVGDGTFFPPIYSVAVSAVDLETFYYDADGFLDLAVATYDSRQVRIYRNRGNGTLELVRAFDLTGSARSLAAGDFDGDGRLDLAVALDLENRIRFLRNRPVGGMEWAAGEVVGLAGPKDVIAGDWNKDGRADLAVAGSAGTALTILLRSPSGFEFTRMDRRTGNGPSGLVAGDWNGDGTFDLAVACEDGRTQVFENDGWGEFRYTVSYAVGLLSQNLVSADFDKDGRPDLAVSNYSEGTVSILRNLGGGVFGQRLDFPGAPTSRAIVAGDLDGDSRPDLASGNFYHGGVATVSILLNATGEERCARLEFGSGPSPNHAVAGDLDGDGDADLAVVNEDGNANILLFRPPVEFVSTRFRVGHLPQAIALGDIDGDIDSDVLVSNYIEGTVSILESKGNGSFDQARSVDVGLHPRFVASGDLDRDGYADIITANYGNAITPGSITVLSSEAGRGFVRKDWPVGVGPYMVALADLNGDHRLDVIVNNYDGHTVTVYLNDGGRVLRRDRDYSVPWNFWTAVGDLDTDGDPDLVVTSVQPNQLVMLFNDGAARFDGPIQALPTGFLPRSVEVEDLDGDGRVDLAVALSDADRIRVYRNQGAAQFALQAECPTGAVPKTLVIGKWDGEKGFEIVTTDYGSSALSLSFGSGLEPESGSAGTFISAGDASPGRLVLATPRPNPSSGGTRFAFSLPIATAVRLWIFDAAGRRVRSLLEAELSAGEHVVPWDGLDDAGRRVAPGVYFQSLLAGGERRTHRVVLIATPD